MTARRFLHVPAALTAALVVTACSGPGGAPDRPSLVDDITRRGVLRVGVECVYKGTCYVDPATGQRVGYSVDLTELLAKDLGAQVQWVDLEWTALIPAMQTGRVDIVTQGMTNTPDRAKVVEMFRDLLSPPARRLVSLIIIDRMAEFFSPSQSLARFFRRGPWLCHLSAVARAQPSPAPLAVPTAQQPLR